MDRPIIFSAPMVRALLDGRKTQTRRLAWGTPFGVDGYDDLAAEDLRREGFKVSGPDDTERRLAWPATHWQRVRPGDRLWVRENFARPNGSVVRYVATDDVIGCRVTSSMRMPRNYSRLTLTVTATKIERLQTMTTRDARAEGMPPIKVTAGCNDPSGIDRAFINQFAVLWDELHGAGAWAANPEVVCLTFQVDKLNIDALEREARPRRLNSEARRARSVPSRRHPTTASRRAHQRPSLREYGHEKAPPPVRAAGPVAGRGGRAA